MNTRAISEVYGKTENQENSKEVGQDLTKALINQLNEKDKQIDGLIKSLSLAQMQFTEVSHRLQELTDKSGEKPNQEEPEMQQSVSEEEKPQDVAEDSKDQRIKELEQEIEKLEAEKNRPWWKKIF